MNQIISCCGTICSDCEYYPNDCAGCPQIKGKVFWLPHINAEICPIFDCCINKQCYRHCGICEKLPCEKYHLSDPSKSEQENAQILERQIGLLRKMIK